jgi:hypothetical protein
MSMGANPSLMVDVMANTAMLGTSLAQAEAQVRQSSTKMGQSVDGALGKGFTSMISRFAMPAMYLQIGDKIARSIADGMGQNRDIFDTLTRLTRDAVDGIPLAGAFQRMLDKAEATRFGISAREIMLRNYLFGETPMPVEMGRGTYRTSTGGLLGGIPGLEPILRSILGDFFPKVGARGGLTQSADPRRIEARIAYLQERLEQTQRIPSRSEMMAQELSKVMGGSMGTIDTALGSFKFAQESTESMADLVKRANTQVTLMMEIRDEMKELRKLTTAN